MKAVITCMINPMHTHEPHKAGLTHYQDLQVVRKAADIINKRIHSEISNIEDEELINNPSQYRIN